jgi:hypothetical protein
LVVGRSNLRELQDTDVYIFAKAFQLQ